VSQRERKSIEEIFGWLKMIGLLCKTHHRGVARVGWMFVLGLAVYNLVCIRNLVAQPAHPGDSGGFRARRAPRSTPASGPTHFPGATKCAAHPFFRSLLAVLTKETQSP
jgi:hypothetical protein